MSYNVNTKGYYGEFGGAYIPEMLLHNIDELKENYIKYKSGKYKRRGKWSFLYFFKKKIIYIFNHSVI